jgi:hypothetical protein
MKTVLPTAFLALAAALLLPAGALAQPLNIDWYKVGGGGGQCTDGVYTITGTIGQPDASRAMSDGYYSVTGGFWAIYAVQTAGAPVLSAVRAGTNVVVWWDPSVTGWTLQTNVSLSTPATWGNYKGNVVNNSVTNAAAVPHNLFYRLMQ